MVDMIDTIVNALETATAAFSWGPIIVVILGAIVGAVGFSVKRILTRIDGISAKVDLQGNRLSVIETKQNIAAVTNLKVAGKIGVPLTDMDTLP